MHRKNCEKITGKNMRLTSIPATMILIITYRAYAMNATTLLKLQVILHSCTD